MSEGLGAFEEHVSYRPGQQIGTMRTLMKWYGKGAKFYVGNDRDPQPISDFELGHLTELLNSGAIRLAERVTVKKRVPEPAAEPESRPIPTCETCPARVESCTAPGVFQCRLHPAPSSPLRAKHFCFQHPALAGLMQPLANPVLDQFRQPTPWPPPNGTVAPSLSPPFVVTCESAGK